MRGKRYRVIVIGGGAAGMAAAAAALEEAGQQPRCKQRGMEFETRHSPNGRAYSDSWLVVRGNEKKGLGQQDEPGENGLCAERKVLLLESNDRVGKKILATGNGKCNFTNADISAGHYHTDDMEILSSVLRDFQTGEALRFFERLGMLSREKNGCFYPLSETASTVLDVLRLRLAELGCETVCGVRVEKAEKSGDGFFVAYREQGNVYQVYAHSMILATGSRAGGFLQDKEEDPLRIPKSFRLHSTPLYPALTKCICEEAHYYKQLAGVRAQAALAVYAEKTAVAEAVDDVGNPCRNRAESKKISIGQGYQHTGNHTDGTGNWEFLRRETGELQLTKEGISGIAVFQLSGDIAERLAKKRRVVVEINFLPEFAEEELEAWIAKRLFSLPERTLEEFFLGVMHKKILQICLQAEGLRGNARIPTDGIDRDGSGAGSGRAGASDGTMNPSEERRGVEMVSAIMRRAMHFTTEVTQVSDVRQAQVCRGGLLLSQFTKKLECRAVPGLFACGEVLNVDGECGGYNLHFAWASGNLAGREAVRRA